MKTKVNDVKMQETTNNQQKPSPKNNKVDVDTLTFEDLNQLIRQYKYIKSKISKLGEIVISVDGTNLFYVAERKYGLGFQINNDDHWVTQRITTKEKLEKKVDAIKKLHIVNKQLLQARKDLVIG